MCIYQGCESSDFNLISDFFCSSLNPIFWLLMHWKAHLLRHFRLFQTFSYRRVCELVWRLQRISPNQLILSSVCVVVFLWLKSAVSKFAINLVDFGTWCHFTALFSTFIVHVECLILSSFVFHLLMVYKVFVGYCVEYTT